MIWGTPILGTSNLVFWWSALNLPLEAEMRDTDVETAVTYKKA